MNLAELLEKHLVEKVEADPKLALELLKGAKKDLQTAQDNLKIAHSDWALAIAYNAMLYAGRALMARNGYRATSVAHHYAVVQYCFVVLGPDSNYLVKLFNRYRIRRHDVVYGQAESVGEDEAKHALENARKFVMKIAGLLE
jgi:uncharacterized protein (UPF0332 family)